MTEKCPNCLKLTTIVLVLGVATLALNGCTTTSKPSEADNAFEEFRMGMMARSTLLTSTHTERPVAKDSLSQTNQGTIALPPPFLLLPEQRTAREEVEKSGVSPALVEKMLQGQTLTLAEIQELTQHKVSDTNLVKCLRSTGAVYALTTKQIDEMRAASVSNEVLDYLLATPTLRRRSLYSPFSFYHPHSSLWDDYYHGLHHYDHRFDVHHH